VSDTEIVDNTAESRYEVREDSVVLGYAEYNRRHGQIEFTHTLVEPEYGGRGLAGQLVQFALDDARAKGEAVLPFCPYVKAWIGKHPDYLDLVPAAQKERFGFT
jgi:predicted GNAT family acetyltransferase